MMYMILTSEDKGSKANLRVSVGLNGKLKWLYIIGYTESKEEAENYCKLHGSTKGPLTSKDNPKYEYYYQAIKKIGEK